MKRGIALLAAITVMTGAVGCGNTNAEQAAEKSSQAEELSSVSEEESTAEGVTEEVFKVAVEPETEVESQPETEAEPTQQSCRKIIENTKLEVSSVDFSGVCADKIKLHSNIEDLYNVNYLHSGVVGLVGVPVEVSYDETVSQPKLIFTYDKEELRGVPEENLVMLYYNEADSCYDTVLNAYVNTEDCTVSVELDKEGVYLLADAYQWYGVWGMDVSQYEYETNPQDYLTDWELECDTGSIMELCDKEWALANAPVFNVSTPEQLASVVYYVNGIGIEGSEITVNLEKDIDLSGYEWVPMGWHNASKYDFSGTFCGQGHTIKNMKIDSDYASSGFIGYGLSVEVKNVTFENAFVRGGTNTGIVGGQVYMSDLWSNIHLIDCTVEGSKTDCGSIIGREAGTSFKYCSLDNVTVNGEPFEYFSHRDKVTSEAEVVETFTLTMDEDYTLHRDEHEGFRNLGWHIELDGVQQLDRSAKNETSYDAAWLLADSGKHTVYLTAFSDSVGTYVRVSNIIEFEN